MKKVQPRVLVPLAPGFEEVEAIVAVDLLRRAEFEVVTAGLTPGLIEASRGTRHEADVDLERVLDEEFDLILLPGGRPGADHLAAHEKLLVRLERQAKEMKWVAAICAAPLALEKAGVLRKRQFTCHPTVKDEIRDGEYVGDRVCVDGKLITAQGAGVSFEFVLRIIKELKGIGTVRSVDKGLICLPSIFESLT